MTREQHQKLLTSPAWRRLRKKIIAGRRCKRCLMLKDASELEVHHDPPVNAKTTVHQFFDSKRLVCLCKPCHSSITRQDHRTKPAPPVPLGDSGTLSPEWIAFRKRKIRRKAHH